MKGSDENIDQLINEKLSSGNFEIPAAFTQDLTNRLDTKFGKKRGFWLWGLLGFVLLIGTIIIPWLLSESVTEGDMVFGLTTAQEKSSLKNDEVNQGVFTSEKAEELANELNSGSSVNSIVETSTVGNLNPAANISTDPIDITKNDSFASTKKGENSATEKLINNGSSNKVSKEAKSASNDVNLIAVNSDKIIGSSSEAKIAESSPEEELKSLDVGVSTESDSSLVAEEIYIDTVKVYKDSVIIRDSIVIRDSVVIRDSIIFREPMKGNWEVSMLGGAFGTYSKFLSRSTTGYSNSREFEVGFETNYHFSKFMIGTGLKYKEIGESFEYSYLTTITKDSSYVSGYNTTAVLDTNTMIWDTIYIPIYDTMTVTRDSAASIGFSHYYTWLTIPLNFKYKINSGSWSFIPGFGLNISLMSSGPTGNQVFLEMNEFTLDRLKVNYCVSFQIRKSMKEDKGFLYAEPYYQNQLSPTDIKYRYIGLNLGIGFKL